MNRPMDLKSGYPWWAVKNGLLHSFPPLQRDLSCDVAVIGGGITGALIADELGKHGHDVVVIEHRDIGWGSTAASTALLQYEIDTHLTELAERYGEADAVLAYRACVEAIPALRALAGEVRDVDFAPMDSLYYASERRDEKPLREEYELRARYDFPVQWLGREEVGERYELDAPCAILSTVAARVDPYRLVYRLLTRLVRRGGHVFDRCTIARLEPTARGVTLHTGEPDEDGGGADGGQRIRARHVVIAAGYASQQWLKQRVAKNRSSYAFITDPIEDSALGPLRTTMLWESARPYLYLRATGEGRLLIGGEDDATDLASRRDARVEMKSRRLQKQVAKMFPHLPLQPTFAWAGTFAETDDGLPFFGAHAQHGPRVHFAMAYGGNGIVYSMIGAGLLRAAIERRRHPLAALFSFQRLER
jgi:glycine/D-amino acid oxidase-like deaminating enzyme